MKIQLAAATDFGKERTNNEDNFIVSPALSKKEWIQGNTEVIDLDQKGILLVVCDGMGGQNAGEVASRIAIETIKAYFNAHPDMDSENEIRKSLPEAITTANKDIIQHAKKNPDTHNMGTTCVMALVKNGRAYICWAGDSRAYWFGEKAGIRQVSKDHSLVQSMIDKGQLTEEQAFYHPQSNVIMQSLGDPSLKLKPGFVIQDMYDDNVLLLCSDGLNGMLMNHQIEEVIRKDLNLENCCRNLIAAANEAGGHDNITITMCRISETGKQHSSLINTLEPGVSPTLPATKKTNFTKKFLVVTFVLLAALCLVFYFTRRTSDDGKVPPADTLKLAPSKNDSLKKPSVDQDKIKPDKIKPADTKQDVKTNLPARDTARTKAGIVPSAKDTAHAKAGVQLTPIK